MGSKSTFQGRLSVDGVPLVLFVDLRFEDETLSMSTPTLSLGSWPVTEVQVSQLASGFFSLRLGSDTALFAAADPLGFAESLAPRSQGRHLRSAVRTDHQASTG